MQVKGEKSDTRKGEKKLLLRYSICHFCSYSLAKQVMWPNRSSVGGKYALPMRRTS